MQFALQLAITSATDPNIAHVMQYINSMHNSSTQNSRHPLTDTAYPMVEKLLANQFAIIYVFS